jgi:predicted branched-subunit amino acid permease
MFFSARFRQGMKAAIPIWIAFVPSSVAWGIAAQAHGLRLEEVILMSAWVYSGPAQFAVLDPLASGKSALQVLLVAFVINLRFLPMSMALAPFFAGARKRILLLASQFISASSFVVPYLQFQREAETRSAAVPDPDANSGRDNLRFFLGVGMTSCLVWVVGTAAGSEIGSGLPRGFEEGLKFILPGYFAGLLVVEMRGWTMALICLTSLIAAVPGALANPDWGWITTSVVIATVGWSLEQWTSRA